MREIRVVIAENNPRNLGNLALGPVERTMYKMIDLESGQEVDARARLVAVYKSLDEAQAGLPQLHRSEVDVLGSDFYFPTPMTEKWALDEKALAGEESPGGGFLTTRGVNSCVPAFILTSQEHSRNPLVYLAGKFRIAYRGQQTVRFPAWTILLEDKAFCISNYHYVRPLRRICRTMKVSDRETQADIFKKFKMEPLRDFLRHQPWAVRFAQNHYWEHLLETQACYAVFDPNKYEEGNDTKGFMGYYWESQLRRIKDWAAAIQERLLTPVPWYPHEQLVCPVSSVTD